MRVDASHLPSAPASPRVIFRSASVPSSAPAGDKGCGGTPRANLRAGLFLGSSNVVNILTQCVRRPGRPPIARRTCMARDALMSAKWALSPSCTLQNCVNSSVVYYGTSCTVILEECKGAYNGVWRRWDVIVPILPTQSRRATRLRFALGPGTSSCRRRQQRCGLHICGLRSAVCGMRHAFPRFQLRGVRGVRGGRRHRSPAEVTACRSGLSSAKRSGYRRPSLRLTVAISRCRPDLSMPTGAFFLRRACKTCSESLVGLGTSPGASGHRDGAGATSTIATNRQPLIQHAAIGRTPPRHADSESHAHAQ